MPNDEKNKQNKGDMEAGAVTGANVLSPLAKHLQSKFPDLFDESQAKVEQDRKEFEALSHQLEFWQNLLDKQAKNFALTNKDQLFTPDPQVMEAITRLQTKLSDLVRGVSQQDLESMQTPIPVEFTDSNGEKATYTQEEFNQLLSDPILAQQAINAMNERGHTELAQKLAQQIVEPMIQDFNNFLRNGVQAPEELGQQITQIESMAGLRQPTNVAVDPETAMSNIRRNIETFGTPEEKVNQLSRNFKSAVNLANRGN